MGGSRSRTSRGSPFQGERTQPPRIRSRTMRMARAKLSQGPSTALIPLGAASQHAEAAESGVGAPR